MSKDPTVEQALETSRSFLKSFIAVTPFSTQAEMNFPDLEPLIEKMAQNEAPKKIVTMNAKLLLQMANQLKHGDVDVFVEMTLQEQSGEFSAVVMSAYQDLQGESIKVLGMPMNEV